MTDAQRIYALKSLISVLVSALKIVRQTHYSEPPMAQFTHDQTAVVVRTALDAAEMGENL